MKWLFPVPIKTLSIRTFTLGLSAAISMPVMANPHPLLSPASSSQPVSSQSMSSQSMSSQTMSSQKQAHSLQPTLYPFNAEYQLKADGWPTAIVDQTLNTLPDGEWKTQMHGSVHFATGLEYSQFRQASSGLVPDLFYSTYHVFGFGKTFRFDPQQVGPLPDRQTALLDIALNTQHSSCTSTTEPACTITYIDHKKKPQIVHYRILGKERLQTAMGAWPSVHIEVTMPQHKARRFEFYSDPRYPGLMVKVDYYRNDKLDSVMTLTSFKPAPTKRAAQQSIKSSSQRMAIK
ncbi:hypothetical protein LMG33818_000861 [Halomonadaceae bacterium LMG 33818]|uniref:hypothetical protein n=1 Tax=Cernens ardua TaxID=3402176 RepID=UPI003EDC0B1B